MLVRNDVGAAARGALVDLRARHLPQALGLSRALHWPYRLEDWQFALELGSGFAVERDGRLVGTGLWWSHGDHHASIGMIIVAPDAQRQGIGAQIMAAVLVATEGRTSILNSTHEGRTLYERLGFVAYGEVRQHQAILPAAPAIDRADTIRPLRAGDVAAVQAIDRAASGMDRSALIAALLSIGTMLVVERDGRTTGYGCVRRWGRGVVVGPIVATDPADARRLVAALVAAHAGDFVRIDVTAASGLSHWLRGIGLPQVDAVTTMARGDPPAAGSDAVLFAVSNQSLG